MICKQCIQTKQAGFFSLKKLLPAGIGHPIYHSTSFTNAGKILAGGFKSRAGGSYNDAYQDNSVCFSRNLCFSEQGDFGSGQVIFVLDLNKLKHNFKTYQFDWAEFNRKNNPDYMGDEYLRKNPEYYEYEERVSRSPMQTRDVEEPETNIPPKYIEAVLVKNSFAAEDLWAAHGGKRPFYIRYANDQYLPVVDITSFSKDPEILMEDTTTPFDMLRDYLPKANPILKSKIMLHPNTPPEVLASYVNDKSERVREALATNPNTPVMMFNILAKDPDQGVRYAVAGNRNAPLSALRILSKVREYSIKALVATNPRIDSEIMQILAGDHEYVVRMRLAENSSASLAIMQLLSTDKHSHVRRAVAISTKNSQLLTNMSTDSSAVVREAVVLNQHTPLDVIAHLADDQDPVVRDPAEKILKHKSKSYANL